MWQCEHRTETTTSPEVIWKLFSDVQGWKRWNAGIERIEMRGPFVEGTEFLMTPPGQEPMISRLIEVREKELFVDETRGDVVVIVAHRIHRLTAGRTAIVYSTTVTGPDAEAIGKFVAADFPDVLRSLVKLAESDSYQDSN
jgi:Polyketide cyclase / dehydrase and lipid transport